MWNVSVENWSSHLQNLTHTKLGVLGEIRGKFRFWNSVRSEISPFCLSLSVIQKCQNLREFCYKFLHSSSLLPSLYNPYFPQISSSPSTLSLSNCQILWGDSNHQSHWKLQSSWSRLVLGNHWSNPMIQRPSRKEDSRNRLLAGAGSLSTYSLLSLEGFASDM